MIKRWYKVLPFNKKVKMLVLRQESQEIDSSLTYIVTSHLKREERKERGHIHATYYIYYNSVYLNKVFFICGNI